MATGNKILIESEPKGKFVEGYITGTPKPGILCQIDVSEAKVGGRFTYEPYAPGTDGIKSGPIFILLEDSLQGKTMDTAYATGDRCFLYVPQPGDELNVLLQDVSGTGDDHAVGDLLIPDTGTGKFIATTGSPEIEPFQVLEAVTDPTADTLVHAIYTGN